ncbi:hypothetical protein POVCU1_078570 [Plasmodium ovale curtisi]|uniref:Uncharacterized protein n=1 Tax=Plasmodium ovale curtisi TaxID=864141 RepID=A0A1A8XFC5_PLAOA|nr:hypothetical protein POVCU1_078570 [Plasmodium ovale curtisi]
MLILLLRLHKMEGKDTGWENNIAFPPWVLSFRVFLIVCSVIFAKMLSACDVAEQFSVIRETQTWLKVGIVLYNRVCTLSQKEKKKKEIRGKTKLSEITKIRGYFTNQTNAAMPCKKYSDGLTSTYSLANVFYNYPIVFSSESEMKINTAIHVYITKLCQHDAI